ncbi:acetate--CoA ligase family protein [Desulforhopalus singaporensis]|uniref:Acyl-CoA synthetase (NDP forming) n=1 Tax=Desulforhopalus singaporensis TaxID=91360 RepID=A0A1H0S080_9BACT|nr:acetate--CoA ligase family protein [Desulforhopalus singaporensis]SDP34676.1 Acyl-CoA synthetase (NDP forming) [Desulforhopalus singaporensis]
MSNLNEAESKKLLAGYGIPTVQEKIAADVFHAVQIAEKMGFPVVLKALGSKLTHKSDRGLVRLGLADADQTRNAAEKIARAAGADLEGFLLQPMLSGKREFVAGLIRDPMLGPIVMFGLGGVFTEALNDVVFRAVPIDTTEAESMLAEIRSSALLDRFRGEQPADTRVLVDCLVGLSRLAAEHPEVSEVDINPLLVDPDGKVHAVDALVITEDSGQPPKPRQVVSPEVLGKIFNPRSIAFIGASTGFGKWGQSLPANLLAHGYPGPVYLVNPRGGQQWGRPVYTSIHDVPGPIDLAVVTIPAAMVRGLINDFKEKGVPAALLISSGFSEMGEEGRILENEILEDARRAGIVFLGPNTMGIQNPHEKLFLTGVHTTPKAGGTALISQSGNMGVQLLSFAEEQGLGIRAFGGSGNEAMVAIEDFMEAFEVDNKTRTVLLYLESVKDGRRFFKSARRVGKKKPVIILKGGRSEAGDRAAASHTGALGTDFKIFEALCRQSGVVSVHQPLEMLDAAAAFSSLPLPQGRRVAIMTLGGGWGVITSDLCSEHKLVVEPLDKEMIELLNGMLPQYWSHANPVDLVGENDLTLPLKAIEALAAWDGCDAVIHLGVSGREFLLEASVKSATIVDPEVELSDYQHLLTGMNRWEQQYAKHTVALMEKYEKPILGVTLTSNSKIGAIYEVEDAKYDGVFFSSPERAVKALGYMCEHVDFLRRESSR